jgi:hypothetical protein
MRAEPPHSASRNALTGSSPRKKMPLNVLLLMSMSLVFVKKKTKDKGRIKYAHICGEKSCISLIVVDL